MAGQDITGFGEALGHHPGEGGMDHRLLEAGPQHVLLGLGDLHRGLRPGAGNCD